MANITHEDELVTKSDLSSFYEGILPYLGSMPEAICNKFNKSDIYSTDENIIGCWIDGRPLYQKTFIDVPFVKRSGVTENRADAILFNLTESANLNLVGYEGLLLKNASGDKRSPESMLTGTTDYSKQEIYQAWSVAQISSIGIAVTTLRNDSAIATGRTATVTIRYTKTTDDANSFKCGDENDYSTTEKVVGTWLNGKPLYQKTISCGTLPDTNQKIVASGLTNELVKKVFGYAYRSTNGLSIPLPFVDKDGYDVQLHYDNTNHNIYIYSKKDRSEYKETYVTLQYIKTTD